MPDAFRPLVSPELSVVQVLPRDDKVVLVARPKALDSICPCCGGSSRRVHSRYTRRLADLPWQGRVVEIQLHARRFRCGNPECPRWIFTERIHDTVKPHARRTARRDEIQMAVGFTAGGEPGSRLAVRLAMPVSGDTLLRMIRAATFEEPKALRVVGIDDWAWFSGTVIGKVAWARKADLDIALEGANAAFPAWKITSPLERSRRMRAAANLLRERADRIAAIMTLEQGKPVEQSRTETLAGADIIDWFAEEGRRTYGQTISAREPGITQLTVKEAVGPVAAFTPWNFPINQVVRKLALALAAGCTIIVKAPEETPASPAELVRCFADAGLPPGVLNLVFGDPAEISGYLIPQPVIKKISFTGSTAVGKLLAAAAAAGQHMKRATMELGGHAPVLVFNDADVDAAAATMAAAKFRNAGQVCVSPTRFMVQERVAEDFTDRFVAAAAALRVGPGHEPDTQMGPLANERRIPALERMIRDARDRGGKLLTGGKRIGNAGWFFEPTVLADVPVGAEIMNEEPFGPVAIINRFASDDEAFAEARRLPRCSD